MIIIPFTFMNMKWVVWATLEVLEEYPSEIYLDPLEEFIECIYAGG